MAAQIAGTFATNDMIGMREDLADVVYNISPLETPFLNSVKHTEATAMLHEWQTASLAAGANNAVFEGAARPETAGTATVRLTNRTQISTKDATVSGSARAVQTAGRADELDFQLLMRGRELRRDMEVGLLANKIAVVGADSTAAQYGGIGSWIATNDDFGGSGSSPTSGGADARNDGTQRAFTEDQLKTVLKAVFDSGGNPTVLMVGGFNRQVASSFGGGATKVLKAESKRLNASFDIYDSDFGELKIIPNRFQRARDALVLDMEHWAVPFLTGRNMVTIDISVIGDAKSTQILSEYTLQASQEAASGGVFDLTTS